MRKFAVIDIGSNSVRLMFVADGKVLYKSLNNTRLGEGLAATSRLSEAAIARSADAVSQFFAKAQAEGAEEIHAFATAAVRSAVNGQAFVQRVKELCGLTVEVISGEEEAEIGILGALGARDGAVVDVGGASTEIVVKKDGALIYKKSVDIGVVRIKDKCGRAQADIEQLGLQTVKEYGDVPNVSEIYGIGGTATTIAAQVLGLTEYDSNKVTGSVITAEEMQRQADRLSNMSVEEIAKLPCMPKGRADVLSGGAVWLAVLMRELGVQKMICSDRDNLEGYAIKRGLME